MNRNLKGIMPIYMARNKEPQIELTKDGKPQMNNEDLKKDLVRQNKETE